MGRHSDDRSFSKGKGKGKGKGFGKGKGKRRNAAALKSQFWVRKVEEENRTELSGTFTGTIAKYIFKQGWGFIEADDISAFPAEAQKALAKAKKEAAQTSEKETNESWVYFRKPDVDPEMFPLHREEPYPVTFELYTDNKGVGAHNIKSAEDADVS